MKPFYFDRGTRKTFLHTLVVFLKDIKRLEKERKRYSEKYVENPSMDNVALFFSRAKHMEQMLLIGISAEYLLKAVLLKYNFLINKTNFSQFSKEFSSKLEELNKSGYSTTPSQISEVEKLAMDNYYQMPRDDTLSFEECKQVFFKKIFNANYFPDKSYPITNPDTRVFYGKTITYKNAWEILQKIRNNYGHVPEAKSEENGILPFLYDFLVYVAKKEFPEHFKQYENFIKIKK